MVEFTINGQRVQAEKDTVVLEAASAMGIRIPTLCNHKALEPYGGCRLCMVEINAGGRRRVVASCLYPVAEGIEVITDSSRILKIRGHILELLLAREPESPVLKDIAREMGLVQTRFKTNSALKNGKCILCGKCVRVCHEIMGVGAIGFVNRGWRRHVDVPFEIRSEVCMGCGACEKVCPTGAINAAILCDQEIRKIPDEYDMGLRPRSAAYILYPQAIPRKATIDSCNCVHLNTGKCRVCEKFCDAGAINFKQQEEKIDIDVGAIILAQGSDGFKANIRGEYGYGRYRNVITSLELERILSASGPFEGHLQRLSDGKQPKKIAWIQCVGSRDRNKGNPYCSAVCCTYAVKEAIIAKEHAAEPIETTIFYMDMRIYGKRFEEYYNKARDEYGVCFIHSRVAEVREIEESKDLILRYEDENNVKEETFDMVVLSVGLVPTEGSKELAGRLGVELNEYGFCKTSDFTPSATNIHGIYVAGTFKEPRDIPETVMQASSAAAEAGILLAEARGSLVTHKEYPAEIDVKGQEPRIGVFVCRCGINIAGVVDVPGVAKYASSLPGVVCVEEKIYVCSQDSQGLIKEKIREHNLNRVVVASCTPRTHEKLFQDTIREAGLNKYLFEMANIRDQCSWVHQNEPEAATRKAKDLVRMAVAKVRLTESLYPGLLKIKQGGLVIVGGLSGMTAALTLADAGFKVYLVERETELGGVFRRIKYSLDGTNDPQQKLRELVERIRQHENICLYTNTVISSVEGSIGNFISTLSSNGKDETIEHGIIIVANGASELKPTEYLYGQDKRVMTQIELEERMADLTTVTPANAVASMTQLELEERAADSRQLSGVRSVVMIQCVWSRQPDRVYCSRICCQQAVKNALKLKEINPELEVYVLYRDIRTYGFKEAYYQKAREKGVIFIRYSTDNKPIVSLNNGGLSVDVIEPLLDVSLKITPDLLVLSSPIVPDNQEMSKLLRVPLGPSGFLLEAHMKLKPVEFATEGIYLCGLAHRPKTRDESISQAQAAASRAATILSKNELELDPALSFVVDANCDGCAYCVDPCPYKAITMVEYMRDGAVKKTVRVDEAKCKGCGVCMATCPKKGIYVRHFKLEMLSAMVEAALQQN
ncbi:FAD-dependent oxidoreductase [bacterium]|nr:FAD-dependent oxidoreductase [bacterium]